jgi:hypothetical protein
VRDALTTVFSLGISKEKIDQPSKNLKVPVLVCEPVVDEDVNRWLLAHPDRTSLERECIGFEPINEEIGLAQSHGRWSN